MIAVDSRSPRVVFQIRKCGGQGGGGIVPGLLQTEEYARAVITGTLPMASQTEVEQRVRARLERQELLRGDSPRDYGPSWTRPLSGAWQAAGRTAGVPAG